MEEIILFFLLKYEILPPSNDCKMICALPKLLTTYWYLKKQKEKKTRKKLHSNWATLFCTTLGFNYWFYSLDLIIDSALVNLSIRKSSFSPHFCTKKVPLLIFVMSEVSTPPSWISFCRYTCWKLASFFFFFTMVYRIAKSIRFEPRVLHMIEDFQTLWFATLNLILICLSKNYFHDRIIITVKTKPPFCGRLHLFWVWN